MLDWKYPIRQGPSTISKGRFSNTLLSLAVLACYNLSKGRNKWQERVNISNITTPSEEI